MKLFFIFAWGPYIREEITSLDMGGTGQQQLLLIIEVAVSFFLLSLQYLRHLTRRPVGDG